MSELIDAEVIEAASDLAALIEAEAPKHQAARDQAIRGALGRVAKLARSRFRAQRKSVLDSHALGKWTAREAEQSDRERLESDIALSLGTQVYAVPVTTVEQQVFAAAVEAAILNGGEAVADMLKVAGPASTESFVAEYLKDGGFSRLTGDLDKTTVDNLASAVADAYESGADFDGVVQAVKDSFTEATTFRAKMIAQTELNDAWNQSVMHFGDQAGATKKSWVTDLNPCIVCVENSLSEFVDINEDFPSGDDAPPAHPNCLCSLMVHA